MSEAHEGHPADGGLLAEGDLVEVLLIGSEGGYVCGCWDGTSIHVESTGQVKQEFPAPPGGSPESAVRDLLAARSLIYELPGGAFLDVHSSYLESRERTVRDFFSEVRRRYTEVHLNGRPLEAD